MVDFQSHAIVIVSKLDHFQVAAKDYERNVKMCKQLAPLILSHSDNDLLG